MTTDNPLSSDDIAIHAREVTREVVRENRTLRWKLKTMGKQLGAAGRTIYQLRNEVDALRSTSGNRSMGDHRRLLAQLRNADADNGALRIENAELRRKLNVEIDAADRAERSVRDLQRGA